MSEGSDAVIFDLDGTLIDTERLYVDCAVAALAHLGHGVARDFVLTLVGHSDSEGNRRLARHIGPAFDERAFTQRWSLEIDTRAGTAIDPMPGAAELLGHLAARATPRAIATNSATATAHRKLSRAGLTGFFQAPHVFGHDRAVRPKPAPDLFLAAAAALATEPARCLVFEDSHTGVEAALAAGMRVVHVAGLLPDPHPDAHIRAETLIAGARAARLFD
ncbi:MAG: HAD family hydrolase [Paracoccaceae bacterium]